MAQVHERCKMNCGAFFLCLLDHLLFAVDLVLAMLANSSASPNYLLTAARIRGLHCLGHWNRFVHKIIKTHKNCTLFSNVIVMIPVLSLLDALSCSFVSLANTCKQAFSVRYFYPSQSQWNFSKLSLPRQACEWVTIQIFVQEEPEDLECLPRLLSW